MFGGLESEGHGLAESATRGAGPHHPGKGMRMGCDGCDARDARTSPKCIPILHNRSTDRNVSKTLHDRCREGLE